VYLHTNCKLVNTVLQNFLHPEAKKIIHLIHANHAMKVYVGGGLTPRILKLDARWKVSGQTDASAALPPAEGTNVTHWVGGCMCSCVGLDALKERTSFSYLESKYGPSIFQLIWSSLCELRCRDSKKMRLNLFFVCVLLKVRPCMIL
jgi:hypothetical protein